MGKFTVLRLSSVYSLLTSQLSKTDPEVIAAAVFAIRYNMSARLLSKAPRAYLFTQPPVSRSFSFRTRLRGEDQRLSSSGYGSPAPPRLPKEEQELFESLQRQSTGAFSTARAPPKINQSPDASGSDVAKAESIISERVEKVSKSTTPDLKDTFKKVIEARGKGEELHPDVKRGASPEFEGERNPKTGEVGGPKNDPLRWGASGEWTYNGRATDF